MRLITAFTTAPRVAANVLLGQIWERSYRVNVATSLCSAELAPEH
jgi:hypothetical protein